MLIRSIVKKITSFASDFYDILSYIGFFSLQHNKGFTGNRVLLGLTGKFDTMLNFKSF